MTASLHLKVFASCAAVLFFKVAITQRKQAVAAFKAGERAPEDQVLVKGPRTQKQHFGLDAKDDDEKTKKAKQDNARWKRVVANDTDSIPLALVLFGTGALVETHSTLQIATLTTFTVARILHTILYLKAKTPHRSIAFLIGAAAIVVSLADTLICVYA